MPGAFLQPEMPQMKNVKEGEVQKKTRKYRTQKMQVESERWQRKPKNKTDRAKRGT